MNTINFKGQLLHYDLFYIDKNTFCMDFGDGELKDSDGEDYFWHIEYHLDTKEYIFEIWYENEHRNATLTDICQEEKDGLINIIQQSIKGGNKINEIVKVYTECLNADGYGDFVRCNDCGMLMLMQIGGMACENCESENLEWVDAEHQECSVEELKQLGYVIVEM